MNKPLNNHLKMLNKIMAVLERAGITANQEDACCYRKLSNDADCCHFELYGFTHFPIKIKTAYAEDMASNQAERYVTQMSRIRDEAFFIYHGYGWKKQTYKRALCDIKRNIGADHVFNVQEFEEWLIDKLEEKEGR
jgi:hypothetical protein